MNANGNENKGTENCEDIPYIPNCLIHCFSDILTFLRWVIKSLGFSSTISSVKSCSLY